MNAWSSVVDICSLHKLLWPGLSRVLGGLFVSCFWGPSVVLVERSTSHWLRKCWDNCSWTHIGTAWNAFQKGWYQISIYTVVYNVVTTACSVESCSPTQQTSNYCSSINIKCTSLFLHAAATVSPELFQATDATPPLNVELYTLWPSGMDHRHISPSSHPLTRRCPEGWKSTDRTLLAKLILCWQVPLTRSHSLQAVLHSEHAAQHCYKNNTHLNSNHTMVYYIVTLGSPL